MKQSNKTTMLSLCKYYKGESSNPFMDGSDNKKLYWEYERTFFSNPNVFQSPNMEEDFKNAMIQALDGKPAEGFGSIDEAFKDYFKG